MLEALLALNLSLSTRRSTGTGATLGTSNPPRERKHEADRTRSVLKRSFLCHMTARGSAATAPVPARRRGQIPQRRGADDPGRRPAWMCAVCTVAVQLDRDCIRALREAGTPMPKIGRTVTINTGKNAGKNAGNYPSVASRYRALTEAATITYVALCDVCRPVGASRMVAAPLLLERVSDRTRRRTTVVGPSLGGGQGSPGRHDADAGNGEGQDQHARSPALKRNCSLVRPSDAARQGRGRAAGWSVVRCSRLPWRRTPRAASR